MTAITSEAYLAMARVQPAWPSASATGNVFLRSALQDWQLRAIEKIAALRNLQDNWDSYDSLSISDNTLDAAAEFVASPGLPPTCTPRVLPIQGGGVQIGWQRGSKEVDVEIGKDLSTSLLLSERAEPVLDLRFLALSPDALRLVLAWVEEA